MKTLYRMCLLTIAVLWASFSYACPGCWWQAPDQQAVPQKDWMWGMPSVLRHHYVMWQGIPSQYQGLSNPVAVSDTVLETGKRVYQENCVACHGAEGRGDGEAGKNLSPQPADLRHLMYMSMMTTDAYLYWTIAEGGKPIGSDMPAFKNTLSKEEIWSLIHYLRREI